MKRIAVIVLVVSLMFSLSACLSDETKDTEKITLCLDWTPNTNHTGIYVALLNGYYEEEGIDLEIVQPPEDGSAIMCASGMAELAIDSQDYLAPVFSDDDPLGITAIAAILQHNTSGMLSRKGDGIDSAKGLEGKRYSTWNLPVEQAIIKNVMEKENADFDKVKLIPNNITDEAVALDENQTDAVWIYYGWSGINAEMKNVECDFWKFTDVNPVFDFYAPVIIGNNDFLSAHPDVAKAFIRATAKGYEYAIKNPVQSAKLLIKGDETGSLDGMEEFVIKSQEWVSEKYIDDSGKWGIIDEKRWNEFYSWLWENKLIENPIPEGYGFTNEFTEQTE